MGASLPSSHDLFPPVYGFKEKRKRESRTMESETGKMLEIEKKERKRKILWDLSHFARR